MRIYTTKIMASQTADADPLTIKPFSKTIQFLSIIDNEKVLQSAHKTKVWLLTFNFDEEQTDDDARFVKDWINNSFSNAIYCSPHKISKVSLSEKIRMMLLRKHILTPSCAECEEHRPPPQECPKTAL